MPNLKSPHPLSLVFVIMACVWPRPGSAQSAECKKQLPAFTLWVTDLLDRTPVIGPSSLKLASCDGATRLKDEHPTIYLAPMLEGNRKPQRFLVNVDGYEVDDVDQSVSGPIARLRSSLATTRARRPISEAVLAIDESTPWAIVAATVNTLQAAGTTRVGLVFAMRETLTRPGPSALGKKLAALPRAQHFGLWRDPTITSCSGLGRINLAGGFGYTGNTLLKEHLIRRIEKCSCSVDLASLKSLLYAVHYNAVRGVLWRQLSSSGTVIRKARGVPWREVHAALRTAPAGKALTVAVDSK